MTIVVVAAITSATKNAKASTRRTWAGEINARVIYVLSGTSEIARVQENWLSITKLSGTRLAISYDGPILPKMSIRSGILFRIALDSDTVAQALETVAQGQVPTMSIMASVIRPLAQPCVRVPLEMLKELRGQEVSLEMAKLALVDAWETDRKTGKAALENET
jgi:hypothetical protein